MSDHAAGWVFNDGFLGTRRDGDLLVKHTVVYSTTVFWGPAEMRTPANLSDERIQRRCFGDPPRYRHLHLLASLRIQRRGFGDPPRYIPAKDAIVLRIQRRCFGDPPRYGARIF